MGWCTNPDRDQEWFDGLLIENSGPLTWDEREQEHGCSFAGVSGKRIWKARRSTSEFDDETPGFAEVLEAHERGECALVGGMDFGSGPSLTTLRSSRTILSNIREKVPILRFGTGRWRYGTSGKEKRPWRRLIYIEHW